MDNNVKPSLIQAEVTPSMKKQNYHVEISYDLEEGVKSAYCACPRGEVSCHHMAATLYYAHYHVSATDIECQWSAPRSRDAGESAVKVADVYPQSRPQYRASQRNANADEVTKFRHDLGETNCVGFSWLLRPEPTEEAIQAITDIEEILHSPDYVTTVNKKAFLKNKCTVSTETIRKVEQMARGQHKNPNWHIARKHRLTASKFGAVLAACRRNRFPPSLYKNLAEGYNLDRVSAVQWGRENEPTAINEFKEVMDMNVEPTGLWLHPSGFLGATPDGLVNDDAVLEVKWPFKYRNAESLPEVLKDPKWFCHYNDQNEILINCDHNYYHQAQAQMHFTGRNMCYFVI